MSEYQIEVIEATHRRLHLSMRLDADGFVRPVGLAIFLKEHERLTCDLIHIDPQHRRKGLARRLHDEATQHFGEPVEVSKRLTGDSVEFYTALGYEIPADAEIRPYDEWF